MGEGLIVAQHLNLLAQRFLDHLSECEQVFKLLHVAHVRRVLLPRLEQSLVSHVHDLAAQVVHD